MNHDISNHAQIFEKLAKRLRDIITLAAKHNGSIDHIIGLTYGFEGLNYAIQANFEDKEARKNFEDEGEKNIEGFGLSHIPGGSYLILLKVFI